MRVARILDLASSVAKTRGTLMHALFEQIVWLDDGVPDSQRLRHMAESLTTLGLDVDEQLSAFQRMLRLCLMWPPCCDVRSTNHRATAVCNRR